MIAALLAAALAAAPTNGTLFDEAPEVLALPPMSVWATIRFSPPMSLTVGAIDIGQVEPVPGKGSETNWVAQWSHSRLAGDRHFEWFERSVPERTDESKCPALSKTVKSIQSYIAKSNPEASNKLDAGGWSLYIYKYHLGAAASRDVYMVSLADKGRGSLKSLLRGSMRSLGKCFPDTAKMYPVTKPMPVRQPIIIPPIPK